MPTPWRGSDGSSSIGPWNRSSNRTTKGETATAVAECLPVVFESVAGSSLPAAQKILFAIDAHLADDYDVLGDTSESVLAAAWQPADWSAVADTLQPAERHVPWEG